MAPIGKNNITGDSTNTYVAVTVKKIFHALGGRMDVTGFGMACKNTFAILRCDLILCRQCYLARG